MTDDHSPLRRFDDRHDDRGSRPRNQHPRRPTAAQRRQGQFADNRAQRQPPPTPESSTDQPAETHPSEITGHGHGHGHDHAPASHQVNRLLAFILIPVAIAAVAGALLLYPFGHHQRTGADLGFGQYPVNGEVVSALAGSCTANTPAPPGQAMSSGCITLQVHMQDGPRAGATISQTVPLAAGTPRFAVGDKIVLAYSGTNPQSEASYQVVDFQRGGSLATLALIFAGAVLVLGRWQGFAALAALGLSFVVLLGFILPAVLAGRDPLLVAIVGAGLIMFVVLYMTHGFSARTSTAVLGTLLSLGLIGVLSTIFSGLANLTGLDEDTSTLISALNVPIDTRGLLLAGIVIGALGVLDDVTVTQTSAVWELRRANPALSWRELYASGLRIGRDHVSSAVNTLVLAYAGAALPLLLAYTLSGRTFTEIVSSQAVAQEVVRTLVGSIGLVAAVPITTGIAAAVAVREPADFLSGTNENGRRSRTTGGRVSEAAAASATTRVQTGRHSQRR